MEKIVDNLLEPISEELTNEIDLFLINNIEDKDVQLKIIDLINKSYLNGINNAVDQFEEMEKDKENERIGIIEETHRNFTKEFTEKLLGKTTNDRTNDTISE